MNNGVKRYASESQLDWELLKNRPFYTTDPIETILVENYSAEVVDTFQPIVDPFSFELVEGLTYIVTWDDVIYECAAYKPQEFAPVCIGNASLVGIEGFGNEEPFCITTGVNAAPLSIDDTYTNPMLLFASTSGTHTVKIVNVVRDIVKLDEKYLPETTKYQSDWNINDESSAAYIANRPFYTTDPVETTLVEESSIEIDSYTQISSDLYFTEEQTYTVTFNGTEYECVAWVGDDNAICIGNGSIYGGNGGNDEPFSCDSHSDGSCYLNVSEAGTYTIKITGLKTIVVQLDEKYISYKPGLVVESKTFNIDGQDVVSGMGAEIFNDYTDNIATGNYSHAEGYYTIASGENSHAEGYGTIASGDNSHAEGSCTKAIGQSSHAEGSGTKAIGNISHAEGWDVRAVGVSSHAEGSGNIYYSINIDLNSVNGTTYKITDTIAETMKDVLLYSYYVDDNRSEKISNVTISDGLITHITLPKVAPYKTLYFTIYGGSYGDTSHSEGYNSIAAGKYQHVQGKYNVIDSENKYAHIVGNGSSNSKRSNAHTVDWEGNAWYKGSVEATALILKSPNGTRFSITVGDDGVLTAAEITA